MNSFYAVRRSATNACSGCEPSGWEDAISSVFQDLQNEGDVTSWSVDPYSNGVIVNVTIPGEPPAELIILPRTGKRIDLNL
jgi:hypothetical protein